MYLLYVGDTQKDLKGSIQIIFCWWSWYIHCGRSLHCACFKSQGWLISWSVSMRFFGSFCKLNFKYPLPKTNKMPELRRELLPELRRIHLNDLHNPRQRSLRFFELIWVVSCGQFVHYQPETPDVTVGAVRIIADPLRTHVYQCSNKSMGNSISFIQKFTDSKVSKFNLSFRV